MLGFEEGYEFFAKNAAGVLAGSIGENYVNTVNIQIDDLVNSLNNFSKNNADVAVLKGNIAEFWHAKTFNINAAINDSAHKAFVEESNKHASIDVSTNFGENIGIKTYENGIESAKQQAKSIYEKFAEYKYRNGKDSIEEYLSKRGYSDDTVLNDPLYAGQIRLIPADQLNDATKWLERKINEEAAKRPEQVMRYQETLELLRDRIKDNKGNESIPLTKEDAEKLAQLAKEGGVKSEDLGLTTEELIHFENILKQAFKAGLTAATISMVLKVAPEIIKAIKYLIDNGELEEEHFKNVGFAALKGASEGFIRGTIAAALSVICQSGLLGDSFKSINPTFIGTFTVLVINTMKKSFNVATGKMTTYEMANDLIKEMFITTCSLGAGTISQVFINIPVLGFMIGSFVGSIAGSFIYQTGYKKVVSFCIDTGFTMFGLVDQNYELPEDVIREIGIEVFDYERFEYNKFEPNRFEYNKFQVKMFEADMLEFNFLRRGVIGVSQIGYI